MFAPYCSARLQGIDSAGGCPRKSAECTRGSFLSAPIEAVRSSSLAWPKTRSLRACSLAGLAGIAQQMVDLQLNLQTDGRCMARTESSNLTADIPAVYHPLTVEG